MVSSPQPPVFSKLSRLRLRSIAPRIAGLLLIVLGVAAADPSAAQVAKPRASGGDYPARPVRLLVGFSPGGGTDLAVRIIGKQLTELWGQQVVIDNRPGAGGLLAFDMVAYGIFTTGATPRAVVDRLSAGFVQALKSPDVIQQLNGIGLEPVGNSPAEFAAIVRSEIRQWGEVIRRAGIKAE